MYRNDPGSRIVDLAMTLSMPLSTTSNAAALSTSQLVSFAAVVAMLGLVCYAGGRLHQYFKQGVERDQAFRDGFNTASRDLFSLATRVAKNAVETPPPLELPPVQPVVQPVPQQHLVSEVEPDPTGASPAHMVKMTQGAGRTRRARSRHGVDTGELSSFQQAAQPTAWDQYRGSAVQDG